VAIAEARPASSVVLVRPTPAGSGWQTYLVQRSTNSPLLADFWVFPGGTLRPDDYRAAELGLAPRFSPAAAHAALTRPPGGPAQSLEESLAYFVAAARELFEEAGIVLGHVDRDQAGGGPTATSLATQRLALEHGRDLVEVAHEIGLDLELERLVYYAHWITPEAIPQRFDTRFFLAVLPDGQEAAPSPYEIAAGEWIAVPDALSRGKSGDMQFHFATLRHLQRLAPFTTVDDVLGFARSKPVHPVMPSTREREGRPLPFLPPELDGVW
jgi:8-oxo-dGTP pyrophosphatase MutT (NUDIX family)